MGDLNRERQHEHNHSILHYFPSTYPVIVADQNTLDAFKTLENFMGNNCGKCMIEFVIF